MRIFKTQKLVTSLIIVLVLGTVNTPVVHAATMVAQKVNINTTPKTTPNPATNTTAPTNTQGTSASSGVKEILENPLGDDVKTIPDLVFKLLNYLFMFIGVAAVIMVIYGGFMMVVSGGNEERLTTGKKTVFWAIGGLVTALMAFSIVSIMQNILS